MDRALATAALSGALPSILTGCIAGFFVSKRGRVDTQIALQKLEQEKEALEEAGADAERKAQVDNLRADLSDARKERDSIDARFTVYQSACERREQNFRERVENLEIVIEELRRKIK